MEEFIHRVGRAIDPLSRQPVHAGRDVPPDELDVASLAMSVWRNLWLIALSIAVALLLGYVYAFHLAEQTYRATASIMLRQNPQDMFMGAEQAPGVLMTSEQLSTERAVLVSQSNLAAVVAALDLTNDPEFNTLLSGGLNDYPDAARAAAAQTVTVATLGDAVRAQNLSGTMIVQVSAESTSPVKARAIANALVDQYKARHAAEAEAERADNAARLSERLAGLQQRLSDIETQIADFQFTSSEPGQQARDTVALEKLSAEANAGREIQSGLISRYSEVSFDRGTWGSGGAILDRAEIPFEPISPRRKLILACSLLLGGVIGLALALGRDWLSNRVRSPRDLARLTARAVVPVAASFKRGARRGTLRRQFGLDEAASVAAIERVRGHISLSPDARAAQPQQIAVVSAMPGEGKTPLAVALAASYADAGLQVLLVDADMRERTLTRIAAPDRTTGLISVLTGVTDLAAAVVSNELLGVDVLPSEVSPKNALDLLASDQFQMMINAARLEYDIIVVDTAPLLAVSDAQAVCRSADYVLYSARQNRTVMQHVTEGLSDLGTTGATVDAIVLSEVRHGPRDAARERLRKRYVSKIGEASVKVAPARQRP